MEESKIKWLAVLQRGVIVVWLLVVACLSIYVPWELCRGLGYSTFVTEYAPIWKLRHEYEGEKAVASLDWDRLIVQMVAATALAGALYVALNRKE